MDIAGNRTDASILEAVQEGRQGRLQAVLRDTDSAVTVQLTASKQ